MKPVIAWAIAGFLFALTLALPAKAWAVIGLFVAAGLVVLGAWALFLIGRGAARAWRRSEGGR